MSTITSTSNGFRFRDILRSAARARHVFGAAATALTLLAAAGCAPRQAIVESEPGRGGDAAAADEDVLATLRSDLRLLAGEQETYWAENGHYAARASDLRFTASSGVRLDIVQGDRGGWSAVASSGDEECGMYEGEVRPPRGYLTQSGRVACR